MGCGQRTFDGRAWLKKRENELRAARSEGRAAFRLNASRFCMTRSQQSVSMAEKSENFLASRFSLLAVQISEADFHRSKNKEDVWWDYRLYKK